MEGGVAVVARPGGERAISQSPGERGRPAEQLLVEVVADPADRLSDEQSWSGRVQECGDVGAGAAQPPQPDERAGGHPAPDPQSALPDRERTPPVVWYLVPARREVVEPAADQAGREPPDRDLVHELTPTALLLPAAHRQTTAALTPRTYISPYACTNNGPR